MRSTNITGLIAAALVVLGVSGAQAVPTTLSGAETSDNFFTTYLSTNNAVLGTQIDTGNNWGTTYTFSGAALTPGVTNYLHVVAGNGGGPEMYIGDFTLSDTGFHFSNGTQHVATDLVNWAASPGALVWYTPTGTPVSFGANGAGPWGVRPGIDGTADFIWSNPTGPLTDTAFFSTVITPNGVVGGVPEPGTLMLLGGGLLSLAGLRRRRTGTK